MPYYFFKNKNEFIYIDHETGEVEIGRLIEPETSSKVELEEPKDEILPEQKKRGPKATVHASYGRPSSGLKDKILELLAQGLKPQKIAEKLSTSIQNVYGVKSKAKKEGILSGILEKATKPKVNDPIYSAKKDELIKAYGRTAVNRVVDMALMGEAIELIVADEEVGLAFKDVETIIKHLELENL